MWIVKLHLMMVVVIIVLRGSTTRQPSSTPHEESGQTDTESGDHNVCCRYRVPQLLERRAEESLSGGPGIYEIPTFLDALFSRSHCIRRDVGFTLEKRFKSPPRKKVLPGPGTYKYKDAGWMRRQWTPLCPFEWDGFVGRGIRYRKSWELAPNRYNYIDPNSITGRVNKKVSERGPYDVFTGPRDESTIKNHFAPSSFKGAKTWLRSLPSELDRLKKNPQYGRWMKKTQLGKYQSTLQDDSSTDLHGTSTFPGPSDYYPIGTYKYHPKPAILYPFGSSVANPRPRMKSKLSPGPGRYTIKAKMPCHGHRVNKPVVVEMFEVRCKEEDNIQLNNTDPNDGNISGE